jgi:hypothetical protein
VQEVEETGETGFPIFVTPKTSECQTQVRPGSVTHWNTRASTGSHGYACWQLSGRCQRGRSPRRPLPLAGHIDGDFLFRYAHRTRAHNDASPKEATSTERHIGVRGGSDSGG